MDFPVPLARALVVIAIILSFSGSAAYIRDTLAGRTKPNLVSWSLWAFAPLVWVAAAFSAGADPWASARILLAGLTPLAVTVIALSNRKSYWRLTFFDGLCGAFAIGALVAWLLVDSPRIAILLAAVGDGFATLPTVAKAWKHPETETGINYILSFASAILVIPSIPAWNIENAAFQVYLLAANVCLVAAVYRKRFFGKPSEA